MSSPDPSAQPLAGKRIVVTRAADQAGKLKAALELRGAEVLELPLIRVTPAHDRQRVAEVFAELGHYDWIAFTSVNGVRCFFDLFFSRFSDIRTLGIVRLGAVGPATAQALAQYHLAPEVTPSNATAEALGAAMADAETLENLRVLLVTGNLNKETLRLRLEEEMAIVDTLQVYRTDTRDISKLGAARKFREQGADALVFASSSAVTAFAEQAAHLQLLEGARTPLACSIGPQTSAALKEAGLPVALEANPSTLDGLLTALVAKLGS